MEGYNIPRFNDLPKIGLYLEQAVRLTNDCLIPLDCQEMTISMVSNYVKNKTIPGPIKKLYYREQLAYIIMVSLLKTVLSLEEIRSLFKALEMEDDLSVKYDYFCRVLELCLELDFGNITPNAFSEELAKREYNNELFLSALELLSGKIKFQKSLKIYF